MKFQILILDDEILVARSTKRILEDPERDIYLATTYQEAKKYLESDNIDLMLLDYKLGDIDGIFVLREVRAKYPEISIIMITAYGNIEIAVESMKLGAYDFIQKKEEPACIRFTVQRALANLRLKKEVESLRLACKENQSMTEIISTSPKMKQLLALAQEYAQSDSTVLITGETGTGKNLFARYIHVQSPRFDKPFVSINCAAIPGELIESELFGYEKGAFTGARQQGKKGLFEQAHYGTIFLDEISDLSPKLQTKLLHVLETNEFFRVGSVKSTKINVRVIAAANANLKVLVQEKKFRMDLFYRLNVAALEIPALREHKKDIVPLTKYFVEEFNRKFNKNVTSLSDDVVEFLENAPWFGNVRELRNLVERAMLLKKNDILELSDFSFPAAANPDMNEKTDPKGLFNIHINPENGFNLIDKAKAELIHQALKISKNNRTKAANLLGIPRTTLNFYLNKYS